MTTAVQTQSEYRNLPLVSLTESATNPRRSFDQTALGEFADFVSGHKIGQFPKRRLIEAAARVGCRLSETHKRQVPILGLRLNCGRHGDSPCGCQA